MFPKGPYSHMNDINLTIWEKNKWNPKVLECPSISGVGDSISQMNICVLTVIKQKNFKGVYFHLFLFSFVG